MLATRRPAIPRLPSEQDLDVLYAARLDAVAHPPPSRRADGWTRLAIAGLGLVGGMLLMAVVSASPQRPTYLTPQQQTLYYLVLELAQTSTPDEVWVIQARLDQVVRTMHPQPRPRPEALLPTRSMQP